MQLSPESKTQLPAHVFRFTVGELLPWKGTWFEVMEVTDYGLLLKALRPTCVSSQFIV